MRERSAVKVARSVLRRYEGGISVRRFPYSAHHMYEIVTKILVPIFVGIVLKLVTIWLEKQNEE
ncbi:type I toxin-antitoxin system Fst family toxin [Enterococcus faecalis]